MVAFTGRCLVHRAEIMQLHGAWPDALEEARRAGERFAQQGEPAAAAEAAYRQGEVHRLQRRLRRGRGGLPGGEPRGAGSRSRAWPCCGWPRGRATPRRPRSAGRVGETTEPLRARAAAAGLRRDPAGGRRRSRRRAAPARELDEIARGLRERHAGRDGGARRGARRPRRGRRRGPPWSRCGTRAQVWQELEAPYEAARVRVLLGLACRALGRRGRRRARAGRRPCRLRASSGPRRTSRASTR